MYYRMVKYLFKFFYLESVFTENWYQFLYGRLTVEPVVFLPSKIQPFFHIFTIPKKPNFSIFPFLTC